tara:strand:- start:35681 stop:36283 length:603 start_codon:yes stop_codon:yes gene_type:complete
MTDSGYIALHHRVLQGKMTESPSGPATDRKRTKAFADLLALGRGPLAGGPCYKPDQEETMKTRNPKPGMAAKTEQSAKAGKSVRILLVAVTFLMATGSLSALTEQQKINLLYKEIRTTKAIFIRNGIEYGSEKAVSHLQRKHDYAGDRIKTARQFIKYLATESSMTGVAYKIKFPDGRVVESGPYLLQVLQRIESEQGNQ